MFQRSFGAKSEYSPNREQVDSQPVESRQILEGHSTWREKTSTMGSRLPNPVESLGHM